MSNTINSNTYINPYSSYTSAAATAPFDVSSAQKAAKQQADALLKSLESDKNTVKTLSSDTAQYLDKYVLSMKTLSQNADNVRLDNLDKLLYDKDGTVTDDTVKNTVKAVQDMVDSYNSTVKLLNDNADRGSGTTKQLANMVNNPAPEASMKLVGVTVNKDGTLALDAEKMTEALKTSDPNQLKLYKDLIGGFGGIADGVKRDAEIGASASARSLVQNDLASIQQTQQESNPFREMWSSIRGGGAYLLNNQAATGMLMNILA